MSTTREHPKKRDRSDPFQSTRPDPTQPASAEQTASREPAEGSGQSCPANAPWTFPEGWEAPFRRLVREELDQVLSERLPGGPATTGSRSEPPAPREESVLRVTRGSLSEISVDQVLLSLFEEQCARHGGSADRAMEYILWNFFGKPILSFQIMERLLESRQARTGAVCLEDTVDY
jgi:hypothetical protein